VTGMSEDNESPGEEAAAGTENAETDGTDPESRDPESTDPGNTEDAQKRKFKEALERKTGGKSGGGDAHGQSKIHSAHGPAKAQRSFRRKSGG
jgi:hypothetical protein